MASDSLGWVKGRWGETVLVSRLESKNLKYIYIYIYNNFVYKKSCIQPQETPTLSMCADNSMVSKNVTKYLRGCVIFLFKKEEEKKYIYLDFFLDVAMM